jgi:serine protease
MRRSLNRLVGFLFALIAIAGLIFSGLGASDPSAIAADWTPTPDIAPTFIPRDATPGSGGTAQRGPGPNGERRLVVKFFDQTGMRLQDGKLTPAAPDVDVQTIEVVLAGAGVSLSRLFTLPEAALDAQRQLGIQNTGRQLADLNTYYAVDFPLGATDAQVAGLLATLRADPNVEFAYEEPAPAPPSSDIPPTTPDLTAGQFYLLPASNNPPGIGAQAAWTRLGGNGSGVRVIDVEYDWIQDHEDLPTSINALLAGERYSFFGTDHGDAVVGILGGQQNGYGITGIVHGADIRVSGMFFSSMYNPAQSIAQASLNAQPGDVILLEMQIGVPSGNPLPPCPTGCSCPSASQRYVPMEYYRANFDAIANATAAGRIVVLTAGNGFNDLDWFTPANTGFLPGYPLGNPFDRNLYNSGAVYVGAGFSGASSFTPARAPHCYSNHGTRIDVQGIGDSVVTAGYGDHPSFNAAASGYDPRQYYTAYFSGTSSSGPIVAGAAAALQGIAKAKGFTFTPARMRDLLRDTGVPQNGTRLIGPRPDLESAIAQIRPDTIGVVRGNLFLLRNYNTTGFANLAFAFGDPSDIPLAGDWDGDGVDTSGVYRPSTAQFFLRNSNSTGAPDVTISFGVIGDVPIVGDWDGNGTDSIGVYRPSTSQFFLRNSLTAGFADFTMSFGIAGDQPIAGNWDGSGGDSIGVVRSGVFHLTNTVCNCAPTANFTFSFGVATDLPLAGDWDSDGKDSAGVYRPSNGILYLRNSLSTGFADVAIVYGVAGDKPIAGVWVTP